MKGQLAIFVVAFIALMLLAIYLSSAGYLAMLLQWIASIGWWGNFMIIIMLILTSFPIPMGSTPLALTAGFLYGVVIGLFTTLVGTILGAAIAFIICKRWLKLWVQEKLNKQVAMAALMTAVNRHAFKICFLMRMAPIPIGIQNALLSISKIDFKVYMISSTLGLLPELLLLVYFGSTTKEFTDLINGNINYGFLQQVLMIGEVLICILILVFLFFTGRQAFRQVLKEGEEREMVMMEVEGNFNKMVLEQ